MVVSMIAAATAAKLLLGAKIAIATGPVLIAAQGVVDRHRRKK